MSSRTLLVTAQDVVRHLPMTECIQTVEAAFAALGQCRTRLAPALLQQATVVTDLTSQCEKIGDLHHAVDAGMYPRIVVELGKVLKDGIALRDENVTHVFDSTGLAIQDVAAAARVYERLSKEPAEHIRTIAFS
jgi:ornithine cyclodeaminase/alanine dehydrogenase-like protein (mu-crystallin family)